MHVFEMHFFTSAGAIDLILHDNNALINKNFTDNISFFKKTTVYTCMYMYMYHKSLL